ncbi:MAG: PrsW family glutamic-type intramembrane protease [Patescibacteria group bacterium]|nr:PrsW family glutamic-type intramembrane protease [Patescibacteria group bacterium]
MANQIISAAILGLLPALIWLWFWLKEDRRHPEPRGLLALVFVVGAVAVIPAYLLEKGLYGYFPFDLGNQSWLIGGVLIWSAIEEILKFGAVYLVAFHNRSYDEPVDAMVYMITGAIGFAALENSLFIWSAMQDGAMGGMSFLLTGNFRFLGATLVHIVSSALVGGFIGLAFYGQAARKRLYLFWGLLTAVVLHAIFNYFIISSDTGQILSIFFILWLVAVLVILFFEKVKHIYKK